MKPTWIEQVVEEHFESHPEGREAYDAELVAGIREGMRRKLIRKLAARRKEVGLTQADLAMRINRTRQYISQIERMETPVSLERLVEICTVIDYRIEFKEV